MFCTEDRMGVTKMPLARSKCAIDLKTRSPERFLGLQIDLATSLLWPARFIRRRTRWLAKRRCNTLVVKSGRQCHYRAVQNGESREN